MKAVLGEPGMMALRPEDEGGWGDADERREALRSQLLPLKNFEFDINGAPLNPKSRVYPKDLVVLAQTSSVLTCGALPLIAPIPKLVALELA